MSGTTRFALPTRIRSQRTAPVGFGTRIDLIDRIADLQATVVTEPEGDDVPHRFEVYVQFDVATLRSDRTSRQLLCTLTQDGIGIRGLDRWARYQVLSRGWGVLDDGGVHIHLPRDADELEIVWQIIEQAYRGLQQPVEGLRKANVVTAWDWPKFSRTSLQ